MKIVDENDEPFGALFGDDVKFVDQRACHEHGVGNARIDEPLRRITEIRKGGVERRSQPFHECRKRGIARCQRDPRGRDVRYVESALPRGHHRRFPVAAAADDERRRDGRKSVGDRVETRSSQEIARIRTGRPAGDHGAVFSAWLRDTTERRAHEHAPRTRHAPAGWRSGR